MKPILIIGGGLAGLTLGIGLRQKGVPVTIREAGRYPRHRVCGEFISGRGQAVLERLGLLEALLGAGAIWGETAKFFLGGACSPLRPLPARALCISRFRLDALLAGRFRDLGGELIENCRQRDGGAGEGIVRASGRRASGAQGGGGWFGLKAHARNAALEGDLEMHALKNGYVGLCRLAGGEVNVCGLFSRRRGAANPAPGWREMLSGTRGTALRSRLGEAGFDEASFCSVAGISLEPQRASGQEECRIGDALTMIPPATGNGMSMAFEAAEAAATPLAGYSRGESSWVEARGSIARACDEAFATRLAWGRWLHGLLFARALRHWPGSLVLRSERIWDMLFSKTR